MKRRKRKSTGSSILSALRKNGKRVKRNTSIKMSLHDLRRLISGAKSGKRVKVKARVR
jgi:hypothetical protein